MPDSHAARHLASARGATINRDATAVTISKIKPSVKPYTVMYLFGIGAGLYNTLSYALVRKIKSAVITHNEAISHIGEKMGKVEGAPLILKKPFKVGFTQTEA